MSVRFEFSPQCLWVGVNWWRDERGWRVLVSLLPALPLVVTIPARGGAMSDSQNVLAYLRKSEARPVDLCRALGLDPRKVRNIVEEVGELCNAMLAKDTDGIRREPIQVATVAIRIAEEGDATNYGSSPLALAVYGIGDMARRLLQRSYQAGLIVQDTIAALDAIFRSGDPTFADITAQESQP